jgi:hypothetical protein
VVDRDGLENRCACKRTVGSNPTLSANFPITAVHQRSLTTAKLLLYRHFPVFPVHHGIWTITPIAAKFGEPFGEPRGR